MVFAQDGDRAEAAFHTYNDVGGAQYNVQDLQLSARISHDTVRTEYNETAAGVEGNGNRIQTTVDKSHAMRDSIVQNYNIHVHVNSVDGIKDATLAVKHIQDVTTKTSEPDTKGEHEATKAQSVAVSTTKEPQHSPSANKQTQPAPAQSTDARAATYSPRYIQYQSELRVDLQLTSEKGKPGPAPPPRPTSRQGNLPHSSEPILPTSTGQTPLAGDMRSPVPSPGMRIPEKMQETRSHSLDTRVQHSRPSILPHQIGPSGSSRSLDKPAVGAPFDTTRGRQLPDRRSSAPDVGVQRDEEAVPDTRSYTLEVDVHAQHERSHSAFAQPPDHRQSGGTVFEEHHTEVSLGTRHAGTQHSGPSIGVHLSTRPVLATLIQSSGGGSAHNRTEPHDPFHAHHPQSAKLENIGRTTTNSNGPPMHLGFSRHDAGQPFGDDGRGHKIEDDTHDAHRRRSATAPPKVYASSDRQKGVF